jgi:RecA-family ATPase
MMTTTSNALDTKPILIDRKRPFVLFRELGLGDSKEWLVKGLLGHGEASAFYGKPGDGKSVLVQDMCMHVAAGWPWHDRNVRRGAVLYVALERRKLVERRAIAFRERYGAPDLPFAIAGGVYDFRNPGTAAHIIEVGRKVEEETAEPVVLICIDTLSRALCGGDENSPKDMGAIVNATSILQHGTGAHILWVHHMPSRCRPSRVPSAPRPNPASAATNRPCSRSCTMPSASPSNSGTKKPEQPASA